MIQFLKTYPNTSSAGIVFSTVAIATVIPANSICVNLGELGVMSGENKLKKLAKAKEQLLDRIRNVLLGSAAGRVECYNDGSVSTFAGNTVGLSNEAFVSCGYSLADSDMAQATELVSGALDKLIDAVKEAMMSGAITVKP